MKRFDLKFPVFLLWETLALFTATLYLSASSLFGAFHYEYNLVLACIASILFPLGISYRLASLAHTRGLVQRDYLRALAAPVLTVSLSACALLLFSGFYKTCRLDVGLAWFLLLPVISSFFSSGSAAWALSMAGHKSSKRKILFFSILPFLAFMLLNLRDLYFDPALYLFHPGISYIAGPLYDEFIPLEAKVITFRIWTLLLGLWLFSFCAKNLLKQRCFYISHRIFGLLLMSALFFRPQLGWHYSTQDVESHLGKRKTLNHVQLIYSEESYDDEEANATLHIIDHRVRNIANLLGVKLKPELKIKLFIYPNWETKRKLTGTRYTAIGNPIQQSLHMLKTKADSRLLVHELTHVIAAPYGIPGLGLTMKVGFLEGLATAVEYYREGLSVHEWARAMIEQDVLPEMKEILSLSGFLQGSPSRSYLAAGSFCRWLIEYHGAESFLEVYRGKNFETVYRKPLENLVSKWKVFLETKIDLSPAVLVKAQPRLISKGIFERSCPHEVASVFVKLSECKRKGDWKKAASLIETAGQYAGWTPGMIFQKLNADKNNMDWKQIEKFSKRIFDSPNASPLLKAKTKLSVGDMYGMQGNWKQALENYRKQKLEGIESHTKYSLLARIELLETLNHSMLGQWLVLNQQSIAAKPSNETNWMKETAKLPKGSEYQYRYTFLHATRGALHANDTNLALSLLKRQKQSRPKGNKVIDDELLLDVRTYLQAKNWQQAKDSLRRLVKRGKTQGIRAYAIDQLDLLKLYRKFY